MAGVGGWGAWWREAWFGHLRKPMCCGLTLEGTNGVFCRGPEGGDCLLGGSCMLDDGGGPKRPASRDPEGGA